MGFQLPGFEQGRTYTPKEIFASTQGQEFHPGGIVLDCTKCLDGGNTGYTYEIRAGWLVGRYSSAPTLGRLLTLTRAVGANAGSSSTSLTVDNAAAFQPADNITIGGVAATIAAAGVDYVNSVITLTAAKTWADRAYVLGADGSATPAGVLPEFTKLKNVDNTVAVNKSSKLAIAGEIRQDQLLGDYASLIAYCVANPGSLAARFMNGLKLFSAGARTF